MDNKSKIVVIGAGFGGLQTAQSLAQMGIDCLLIDRFSFHTFVPLLYQVGVGLIEPSWVIYPLHKVTRRYPQISFLQEEVEFVDFGERKIIGSSSVIYYDYLVLATGSKSRPIPDHAFPLRTLEDAVKLQAQLKKYDDMTQKETIVVVGGGATGVEMAGALAEKQKFHIVLVQSQDRLLPDLPLPLARYTQRKLLNLGVELYLSSQVVDVSPAFVYLDNGEKIGTETAIWTTGLQPNLPGHSPTVPFSFRQRVEVLTTLQLPNDERVYVIGDLAALNDRGKYLTGVAPEALQQGVAVAHNIRRQLKNRKPKPFYYFDKGRLGIIGAYSAVGKVGFVNLTGFVPWLLWLAVHVVYLPGYDNRWRVVLRLFWVYLFRQKKGL